MSESVPSSVTGFAHRRPRADSIASFTYFQEEDESPEWSDDQAIVEDEEDGQLDKPLDDEPEYDLESGSTSPQVRKFSGFSKASVDHPLLRRYDSTKTDTSAHGRSAKTNQKIYVMAEDLTIVVAGFSTYWLGFIVYLALCTFSAGLLYLVFRWIPSWRVKVVGSAKPLRECEWVVIEVRWSPRRGRSKIAAKTDQNQWGEFAVQDIIKTPYGHSISTVFGPREKKSYSHDYDEDDDPVMKHLRFLDYRYVRFCFHPFKDKFVLVSDWKDPDWTDVKTMRTGLESDERHRREQVFDKNHIDIKEKTISQLLVDEVSHQVEIPGRFIMMSSIDCLAGFSSILHIPNCQPDTLVT